MQRMETMQNKSQYRPLMENQYYIDKTAALEKGIIAFSSIYIEGAAASGKTTAVKMLLKHHPEVEYTVIRMDDEMNEPAGFPDVLEQVKMRGRAVLQTGRPFWVIFENMPGKMPAGIMTSLLEFLRDLPDDCRAILLGREQMDPALLELLWKRKLDLIPQRELLFTNEEIGKWAESAGSLLRPEKIYEVSGGWAGCVDLVFRLSEKSMTMAETAEDIWNCYEIDAYVKREILDTLSEQELEILVYGAVLPWINTALCQEILGLSRAEEYLMELERKGMLTGDRKRKRCQTALLFKNSCRRSLPQAAWKDLGSWYEAHGYVKEALFCLRQSKDTEAYRFCMEKHYDSVPFLEIPFDEVMEWEDDSPEICYLRGMHCFWEKDTDGLGREIKKLERMKNGGKKVREILLNLSFVNPEVSLGDWLDLLENQPEEDRGTLRLYKMLGGSYTYLCGFRDLTGLFDRTKKEENKKARIWKENLGENEWLSYRLARIDYYLETERLDQIPEEDWRILMSERENEAWQFNLVRLYLLNKLQWMRMDLATEEMIRQLRSFLLREENSLCVRNTEAVTNLYSLWGSGQEKLVRWLRYSNVNIKKEVTEANYAELCFQAKGYLILHQYDKAGKIIERVIPYLQRFHRSRILAEALFMQAVVNQEKGRHSQALRNVIESFLVNGDSRYVAFYASYGNQGKEVLEAYMEWVRGSRAEGWHRKKKYNYGSVLRMPVEDYLEAILRHTRKNIRSAGIKLEENGTEKLTMMEITMLQCIGQGMTNTEICEEQNLKLPTVKSHIYSLYKKLGVNSRVQAIIKGKEMGILEP